MPLKYKLIQKSQPGVAGGGSKKWYANAVLDEELTVDELARKIEKFSALSEADIRGVIIAMENVMKDELLNGKMVRLDVMGTFYPSVSSEGVLNESDFTPENIRGLKINYRPGKRITEALSAASFRKKA